VCGDGRPEAGAAGADHDDVVFVHWLKWCGRGSLGR
jgi:hypothetical protein